MPEQVDAKRIVVTGLGCITASGKDVTEAWDAIKQGRSGIAEIQQWDVHDWQYKLGAEIKNYKARELIADRKLLKLISRQDVLGINAATQALNHSQLLAYRESLADATAFNDKTGVFVGSPGNRFNQQYDFMQLFSRSKGDIQKFADYLFEEIHPMWLLRILPNNVLAYVGIQNGFKGANENVTNHAVSGTQALAEAHRYLINGNIERAVVVAYESGVEPEGQIYYGGLGALSQSGLHSFAKGRDGTVLAEGAGALVLETLASAKQRNAKIYGEILGDATTSEAQGIFPIREDADGLRRCITQVLQHSGLTPQDIGMITAHGNAMLKSDATEALAIGEIFGTNAIPVTGFKWSLGHSLSAAGVIETIMTLLALRENSVPGIADLEHVAQDCATLNVSNDVQAPRSSLGLIITRAFASVNTCLVVKGEVA